MIKMAKEKQEIPPTYGGTKCPECKKYTDSHRKGTSSKGDILYCVHCEKWVCFDKKYLRAEELHMLRGDSSKIRNILGWEPEYTFDTLMEEMLEYWKKEMEVI